MTPPGELLAGRTHPDGVGRGGRHHVSDWGKALIGAYERLVIGGTRSRHAPFLSI
jgi:hypothetical protein